VSPIPSIDLHPDQIGGTGPEAALRALRSFLDRSLKAGHRQVRIVTGVGLRGDGTPRLRTRVEEEVLGAYFRYIEQQEYEQGGAVIKLWLKPPAQKPSGAWHRHERHQDERKRIAGREERYMVARDRLHAAEDAYEEGDWRRCRLKLNQVAKEFGWELAAGALDEAGAGRLLDGHRARLNELDK
jgi:hypothetical protein